MWKRMRVFKDEEGAGADLGLKKIRGLAQITDVFIKHVQTIMTLTEAVS